MQVTITAAQARALRTADSVCFDTSPEGSQIRAIIRGADYSHETTTIIPVEVASVQNYSGDHGPWNCFEAVMCARSDANWQTIARRCKAGTRLALVWHRSNQSPVLDEAGLVCDMLDIKVQNGNVCDTFRVEKRVGLDNSARMVRKA